MRTTRQLPESGIRDFRKLIVQENWDIIKESESAQVQEEALQAILNGL